MEHNHRDPTDHCRTTLPHAGETFIDPYSWPGLVSIALGVISLVGCLAAAAYQHPEWILTTGVVGALAISGGVSWLAVEHHRVLQLESHWRAGHPDGMPDRPGCLTLLTDAPLPHVLFGPVAGGHRVNHVPLLLDRRAL